MLLTMHGSCLFKLDLRSEGAFRQVPCRLKSSVLSVPCALHFDNIFPNAAGQPCYPENPHEAAGPCEQSTNTSWVKDMAGYADQRSLPPITPTMRTTQQATSASWPALGFSPIPSQAGIPSGQAQGSDGRLQDPLQVSQSPQLPQPPHGAGAMTKPFKANKQKGEHACKSLTKEKRGQWGGICALCNTQ